MKFTASCPDKHNCLFRMEGETESFEKARELVVKTHKETHPNCKVTNYAIRSGVWERNPDEFSNEILLPQD